MKIAAALLLLLTGAARAESPDLAIAPATFAGLELRSLGPAFTSGRISDLAVDPRKPSTYYVAAASGGVWKTVNGGATFEPLFDKQGSSSIGCIALDPGNPLVVWVGTGENDAQRSVSYGDGVYKSVDGGTTWSNLGLKDSEHIGRIAIDPRDSDTVYVAAQGPLWSSGGDRGLYKTTDGGKTWKAVLAISKDTGVTDVVLDPRDPDVLYAAAWQRRRHAWGTVNGGPESALYKSGDGGATWTKLRSGLPRQELGRIALAVAPSQPGTIYAQVEASRGTGGIFRSTDRGATWEKRSGYQTYSSLSFQEVVVDPLDADRVYLMDVFLMRSEDGGRTWSSQGERFKHADNHALWIDPADTAHLLSGCDGGLFESFDRGATWLFKPNLPLAQFYRVSADDSKPFYFVYGGTQDNGSLGAPSRTRAANGIADPDWFKTLGGDGFETVIDPLDPGLVYAQLQYGGLVRVDRRSGETLDIQPQPAADDDPPRWYWDSPLIASPHTPTRLYFASQRVFRTDDRGESWQVVSPDLTRRLDRAGLEILGRLWSVDAVEKNQGTSFYGTVAALAESPKKEGLIYAGTDDGLIQVTADGGARWRRIERFSGVPERAFVSDLEPSHHREGTVYAAFDNHQTGDFRPYVLRSDDRGATWASIAGDLPGRGTVYTLAEDPGDPELLFAGTESGLYFTRDGGRHWVRLTGGLPVVAVRDLAIQPRENDLVVGTFGRGIYILDDYTPLRHATKTTLDEDAILFPVKPAWLYLEVPDQPVRDAAFFTAQNPPYGAVFTYYLKEDLKTAKARRQERESTENPSWEALRAEEREKEPAILLTVAGEDGRTVRRLTGPATAGFHRMVWDLRHPSPEPELPGQGPLAAPGRYTVSLAKRVGDITTPLGEPRTFEALPLEGTALAALTPAERGEAAAYWREVDRLYQAMTGASEALEEGLAQITAIQKALEDTPAADPRLLGEAHALEDRLADLRDEMNGDPIKATLLREPVLPTLGERIGRIFLWNRNTALPTRTQKDAYALAARDFAPWLERLRKLLKDDLASLENRLEAAGAPWTPGRLPDWQPE
ncbi:MAG: VPS10 domain-containing protein [Thermoanaerobaculia bacterium]